MSPSLTVDLVEEEKDAFQRAVFETTSGSLAGLRREYTQALKSGETDLSMRSLPTRYRHEVIRYAYNAEREGINSPRCQAAVVRNINVAEVLRWIDFLNTKIANRILS